MDEVLELNVEKRILAVHEGGDVEENSLVVGDPGLLELADERLALLVPNTCEGQQPIVGWRGLCSRRHCGTEPEAACMSAGENEGGAYFVPRHHSHLYRLRSSAIESIGRV